jgi:AcrR family transcriptional regulator
MTVTDEKSLTVLFDSDYHPDMATSRPEGLRERTRRAVRDEVMVTAVALFASRGYAETTVAEIAAAAGVSERTFFRYFATKEDVVLRGFELLGAALADRLAQLPPELPAWPSLRATFEGLAEHYERDPERNLAVLRLRINTPALTAHCLGQRSRWQELLVPHLLTRLAGNGAPVQPDPRPRAIAGAALACLGAAEEAWVHSGGSVPLSTLLDLAMGAVHPLSKN